MEIWTPSGTRQAQIFDLDSKRTPPWSLFLESWPRTVSSYSNPSKLDNRSDTYGELVVYRALKLLAQRFLKTQPQAAIRSSAIQSVSQATGASQDKSV